MVSFHTVLRAGSWVQANTKVPQPFEVDSTCNASRWRESLLAFFVGSELDLIQLATLIASWWLTCPPEQTPASNITDMRMIIEVFM